MRKFLIGLLLSLPLASGAQTWRLQASGGVATLGMVGGGGPVFIGAQIPVYSLPGYHTTHIPEGKGVFGYFGLALLRQSGNSEYGLQLEATAPRRRFRGSVEERDAAGTTTYKPYSITGYVGSPVLPLTAVYNYYPGQKRGNAFVGLHAGVAYAAGRDQADFNEMPMLHQVNLHYHSAWGFTGGVQLGYRKEIGRIDLGGMMQLKYMQLNLRHGSDERQYPTKLLTLPVQLYVGFRFGKGASKNAPTPSPPVE